MHTNIMTLNEFNCLRDISISLINEYHKNDLDKGGNPYIHHLISVSDKCSSYEAKIAGLLHDILEDTKCTEEILIQRGIPRYIVDIILLVTRNDNETYNEFINRIIASENMYALELKYADLKDNCDIDRLKNASEDELIKANKRICKRYIPTLNKIENKLNSLKNNTI